MFTIHYRGQFLVVLVTTLSPHNKDFMMRKDLSRWRTIN